MLKLIKNMKPIEWLYMFFVFGFVVLQVWLELKMPEYMGVITQLVQTPGSALSDILSAGGKMLMFTLLSVLASVIVVIFSTKIAINFSANLRLELFDKVQSFSMGEINRFSIASLITRSTNDITQIQSFFVIGLQLLVKSPILAIWTIVKIVDSGWQWSLATGIAVMLLILIATVFALSAFPKFKRLQQETDELNRMSRENITGLRVVRAYNAENYQEKKFEIANKQLSGTNLHVNRLFALLMPCIDLLMNCLMLAIYWIGAAVIINASDLEKVNVFSNMMVYTMYASQLLIAFMMIMIVIMYLPRALVAARRVNEVLNTSPSLTDGQLTLGEDLVTGTVEFKNVNFKYPDAEDYVLQNINFKAKRGETVAFIGSTGSGKSTLVNLIPRFYDVTEGEILVDGVNIKHYKLRALRDKIGFVPQKAKLFGGTVESNITFGSTANGKPSENDMRIAADISQSKEFIDNLSTDYNSFVAPGGTNFSGGQKQRLSIARAIARRPEIIIFDDSFSALDYKTDKKVRSAITHQMSNTTVFIVAQRIGTIRHADKIIVLNDGQIAGIGTHNELMDSSEVYREIAYSQLSKEELT